MEISLKNYLGLGNRRDSARVLGYMGYGYIQKGDYFNVYGAYKAAAESYLGTDLEKPNSTNCTDKSGQHGQDQGYAEEP